MKNLKLITLVAFLTLCTTAFAQQGAPPFDDDLDDTGAPIPGIALAIAAAVGIGVVKLKRDK